MEKIQTNLNYNKLKIKNILALYLNVTIKKQLNVNSFEVIAVCVSIHICLQTPYSNKIQHKLNLMPPLTVVRANPTPVAGRA